MPKAILAPASLEEVIRTGIIMLGETAKLAAPEPRKPWQEVRREAQIPPEGDWRTWFVRGGRGSGKTRTGAETLAEWIEAYPGQSWAVVAPTFGDARDKCMEGESGLLAALGFGRRDWNRSIGQLELPRGGMVYIDGADDGAPGIQGFNLAGCWSDEVGLWSTTPQRRPAWRMAWDESVQFAVRSQAGPARIVATGTPKMGHPLVKRLLSDPRTVNTRMRTMDNIANLSADAVQGLIDEYGGTRLAESELEGGYLEEVEGALWRWEWIETGRRRMGMTEALTLAGTMERIVVAVDPAVSAKDGSDRTGVCVVGVKDGEAYVFVSRGLQASPQAWAQEVAKVYTEYAADRVIVERNQGGDLVRQNLRIQDRRLPIKEVVATRGKQVRAEPVAALYEQGRVHHVGQFASLEDQMTTLGSDIPPEHDDEVDALVYAVTELLLQRRPDWSFS